MCSKKSFPQKEEVISIIQQVNNYWQKNNPVHGRAFWDNAAYHTGNMEAYFVTKNPEYLKFSEDWAIHNEWKGAKSNDKSKWKYTYGETDEYVLSCLMDLFHCWRSILI